MKFQNSCLHHLMFNPIKIALIVDASHPMRLAKPINKRTQCHKEEE